ncbi:MAG: response regulator [Chloroflexota bacterium]|nr:MAG: response regulator [Chloroflexota bacterium]
MPKPNILIADDEPAVLNAVYRDLNPRYAKDYKIVRADSGATALDAAQKLQQRGETVALFLVDQRMPRMTGTEFLEKARAVFPEAKKVLLTAYADTEAAISSINKVGLDYYLLKPWDPPEDRLYPILDDLLADWNSSAHIPYEGIRIAGTQWSQPCHEAKEFFARYQIPYQFLDIEKDAKAKLLVEGALSGHVKIPTVFFPDGSFLAEPTARELAEKVGLQTRPAREVYDLAIVGSGPAGLAAAVYASSEGLKTIVIEREAPGGQAGSSPKIENYLGFPAGLSGLDLTRRALTQAQRFGTEILATQQVVSLRAQDPYRILVLEDGTEIVSKTVLITTGASFHILDIPGAAQLTGKGVYYGAAYTEAMYFKDENVFVVGGANSAAQNALFLARYCKKVTMLVRSELNTSQYLTDALYATPNIEVQLGVEPIALHGTENFDAVTIRDKKTGQEQVLQGAALFVFIGQRPRTEFARDVLRVSPKGNLLTGQALKDENGKLPPDWKLAREPMLLETNIPGVFAAGDVRMGARNRVAAAVGEGSTAISMVHEYLATV